MELTWSHVPSRMMMSWVQLDSTGGDRIVQRKGFFFFLSWAVWQSQKPSRLPLVSGILAELHLTLLFF